MADQLMTQADGMPAASMIDAAIDWMVLFRSGEVDDESHARFARWKMSHPDHERAWRHVSGALERSFSPLRGKHYSVIAEKSILRKPDVSRRRLLRSVFILGALGATGAAVMSDASMRAMAADLRTGTGERKEFRLADGSRAMLNARSAADVSFSQSRRLLRLREGELIVSVYPDAARRFEVETDCGIARANDGRFLVRQQGKRSFVMVLSGALDVENRAGLHCTLQAGQGIWFDDQNLDSIQSHMLDKAAWQNGMLLVDSASLDEVIDALRPYRAGFIRISPEASRLQVLGGFPLDDTDRLLESLVQTLPIRVTFYSRWLVFIDLV